MLISYGHFFAFTFFMYLALFVWFNNRTMLINKVFFFLMACFAVWSIGKVFLHNPLSKLENLQWAWFLSIGGAFLFPVFVLWIALIFSRKQKLEANPLFLSIMFMIPTIFFIIQIRWPYIFIEKTWFGHMHVFKPGWASGLFFLYYSVTVISALVIMMLHIKGHNDIQERKFTIIYIITTTVCLFFGSITDMVLPLLGYRVIPDIANIIAIIWAIGIAVTIMKFKFFIMSPSSAAGDILKTMADAVLLLDAGGYIQTVNRALQTMLTYSEDEITGQHIKMLFPKIEIDKLMINVLLTQRSLQDVETNFVDKNQKQIPVMISTSLMKTSRGLLVGIVCVAHDITSRKTILEALRDSRQSFMNVVEKSNEGIIVVNTEGDVRFINPVASNWFRLQNHEHISLLLPFPFNDLDHREVKLRNDEQSNMYGEIRFVKTNWERQDAYLLTVRDITRKKQDEEKIRQSLKDKEVLLSEIHHRVKNNLQVILSILRLQLNYENNDNVRNMLLDMQNRVVSMSIIHEMLYSTHELSSINLKNYFQRIVDVLLNVYSNKDCNVNVDMWTEDVEIDISKAIPCGLIVNELVSNSMKYAFKGRSDGMIKIVCSSKVDYDNLLHAHVKTLNLMVGDDGIGLPDDFNMQDSPSLGLRLVHLLCKNQLDGDCCIDRENGTQFSIEFHIIEE